MTLKVFNSMIGRTMTSVTGSPGAKIMRFTACDLSTFSFYHDQDCCEYVRIEDIIGDLNDLLGAPIVLAEQISSDNTPSPGSDDSYTWTFYRFATAKGYVTVRWLGESNGYYSESVDYQEILK